MLGLSLAAAALAQQRAQRSVPDKAARDQEFDAVRAGKRNAADAEVLLTNRRGGYRHAAVRSGMAVEREALGRDVAAFSDDQKQMTLLVEGWWTNSARAERQ
jgi:hypothetical protein